MTNPKDNDEMVKQNDPPELTAKDMRAILHIALVRCGGFAVTKKGLEQYPEDDPMTMSYDVINEVWHVYVPKKKFKRGKIIGPYKRLIVPSEF